MAAKRMFSLNIVDSDDFLELPAGAQNLYFHLCMRADDDGFFNSLRSLLRIVGASEEDLSLLIRKGYLLAFDSGVVAVTHWRLHNQIRKDRYTPTRYKELFSSLILEDGVYKRPPELPDTPFFPVATQIRKEKKRTV